MAGEASCARRGLAERKGVEEHETTRRVRNFGVFISHPYLYNKNPADTLSHAATAPGERQRFSLRANCVIILPAESRSFGRMLQENGRKPQWLT